MPEITFLRVKIADKNYLFDERILAKVTTSDNLKIYSSPFGKRLNYLAIYNNTLMPLFNLDENLSLNNRIVLIIIKMLDLAGVIVDEFIDFVRVNENDFKDAVLIDDFYAKRALRIGDRDCYFFEDLSLFGGEESL